MDILDKLDFLHILDRQLDNLDIIGQFRQFGHKIGQFEHNWTIWIKLDNLNIIGQFGHNWTIWTELDNLDIIGQFGQKNWTIWTKNWRKQNKNVICRIAMRCMLAPKKDGTHEEESKCHRDEKDTFSSTNSLSLMHFSGAALK